MNMTDVSVKLDFSMVYEENFKYIYNFVYMHVLHKETAEDVTSDTFMKALDAYDRYDPELAAVRTWLCTIARNTIINRQTSAAVRYEQASDELPEPVENDNDPIGDHLKQYSINREVENILSKLTQDERELISMRYGADIPVKDIADILGIAPKACTERIRRLLAKCRKYSSVDNPSELE